MALSGSAYAALTLPPAPKGKAGKAPAGAPLKGGLAPGPASRSQGVGRVVGGGLPKTFEGAPKLAKANAVAPMPKTPVSGHSLFSLHTLESAGKDVGKGISELAGKYSTGAELRREASNPEPIVSRNAPHIQEAGVTVPLPFTAGAKSVLKGVENIPSNTVKTITSLPEGIYGTGKAAVNLAKGNPKEAEQIAGNLAHIAGHPLQSFEREPVGTALMASGVASGVGEAAGAALRGSASDALKAVGSTAREPLKLYGDLEVPREYSSDVIRKGTQVAADKFREKVLNQNPNQATGTRLNRLVYGGGMAGQWLEHHVAPGAQGFFKPGLLDKTEGSAKAIRKMYTTTASSFMEHIKPSIKGSEEAVPLAAEGTLRTPATVASDLKTRLAGLQDEAENLSGNELRMNKAQQEQITKLLNNPKFIAKPEGAFEAAKQFGDFQQPLIDRKVQLGILEPDQEHAKMVPYAVQHMGAEYNKDPGKHPLVAAIRVMRQQEKAAVRSGDATKIADARGALLKAERDLSGMKAAGHIKNSGEMYPRLEVNGKPLTHDEIMAHAKKNIGDRELGFITHREVSYGSATHAQSASRPGIALKQARTGNAYKTGAYESSWEGLKRQAYKDANEISAHENRDEVLRRFGIGSYHTQDDAQRAADNFNHTPEGQRIGDALGEVVVAHAGPDRLLARGNIPSSLAGKAISDFDLAEHKAVEELGPEGKYRLIPKMVDERLQEHDKLSGPGRAVKGMQRLTNMWRSTALFTTPRWPVGVGQENAIRLAFANINPFAMFGWGRSAKLGSDLTEHFRAIAADPAATEAQRFAARAQVAAMDAGQQYGSYIYNSVRRSADTMPPEAQEGMNAFTESLPVSKMIAGWEHWKNFVGTALRRVETNTKKAMLGKAALNEAGKFTDQWGKLLTRQDAAVRAYAHGKLTPGASAKLGQDIMDMAGNWNTLTPMVRKAVQTYSPFGLWWLNSIKFIFQTLPKDHPFKTAALAAMEAGTGATSKESSEPSYLAGGIGLDMPIVGHVRITPLHYSPFGIGVEPEKTAAGMILPQVSNTAMTALGINPLTYEPEQGRYSNAKTPGAVSLIKAIETIPEGFVPGVRQAETIGRTGGKPVPGSLNPFAAEPGTRTGLLPAVAKYLAPFPFTAERQAPQLPASTGRQRPLPRARPLRTRSLRQTPQRPIRQRTYRER
jgi:hypothetical protein